MDGREGGREGLELTLDFLVLVGIVAGLGYDDLANRA